nr:RagB/SusD family nutrient uptake outer membrane protein [Parapedobacter tibetensis]
MNKLHLILLCFCCWAPMAYGQQTIGGTVTDRDGGAPLPNVTVIIPETSRGIPNWAGETDFGVIRYADIVLMYAERTYRTYPNSGRISKTIKYGIRSQAGRSNSIQI